MTALVEQFDANHTGRDFAVGDIHGCFTLFERLLAAVEFEPHADRVFCVGDLVDRGPESDRALEFVANHWFFSVRGNHEQMALATATDGPNQVADKKLWYMNGGDWFDGLSPSTQAQFVSTLSALPYLIEVTTPDGARVGIVHADVVGDSWTATRDLVASQPSPAALAELVWSRDRVAELGAPDGGAGDSAIAVADIDVIYFGHTPLARPTASANTRWLDTGAVFGNALSIAELGSAGAVWSMDAESGQVRRDWHDV